MGLGDLMYERFKDRGLTDEEFARFNIGVLEINSIFLMSAPDFEVEDDQPDPDSPRR